MRKMCRSEHRSTFIWYLTPCFQLLIFWQCSWVGKKTRPVFSASVVERLKDRIRSLETELEDCTCQLRKGKDVVDDVVGSVVSMSSTASDSDNTWIDTSASLPEAPPDDTSIDQLLVPTTHLVVRRIHFMIAFWMTFQLNS